MKTHAKKAFSCPFWLISGPEETKKVIFQLGTASAALAVEAAQVVCQDVSGIDAPRNGHFHGENTSFEPKSL